MFVFLNFVILLLQILLTSCTPAQCVRNVYYFDLDSVCNTKCLQWITTFVEMKDVVDCSIHPERIPTIICQSILENYNNTCQQLVSKINVDDPVIDATCKAITTKESCCQKSNCLWVDEGHSVPVFPGEPFEIIYLLNLKCWKGNNRYCEPLVHPIGLYSGCRQTSINYQPLCTDCLPTISQVYSVDLTYISLVCINDQGNYCYNGSQVLPNSPEELRKRCNHSCPPDWILSSSIFPMTDSDSKTLAATSQAICLEENGLYCFEDLMRIGNKKNCDTCSPTCCNKCNNDCPSGCIDYVNPHDGSNYCMNPLTCDEVKSIIKSTNGCCIEAYKNAISPRVNSSFDELLVLGSYGAFEYTLNKCGINDTLPPCTTYVVEYPKTMTIKGNCTIAIQSLDQLLQTVVNDININILCFGCVVDLAATCPSHSNGDQIYISFIIKGMNAERAQQYSKEYDSKSPIIPALTMYFLESIGADIKN